MSRLAADAKAGRDLATTNVGSLPEQIEELRFRSHAL
jgi:hypothetical protein